MKFKNMLYIICGKPYANKVDMHINKNKKPSTWVMKCQCKHSSFVMPICLRLSKCTYTVLCSSMGPVPCLHHISKYAEQKWISKQRQKEKKQQKIHKMHDN